MFQGTQKIRIPQTPLGTSSVPNFWGGLIFLRNTVVGDGREDGKRDVYQTVEMRGLAPLTFVERLRWRRVHETVWILMQVGQLSYPSSQTSRPGHPRYLLDILFHQHSGCIQEIKLCHSATRQPIRGH